MRKYRECFIAKKGKFISAAPESRVLLLEVFQYVNDTSLFLSI